MDSIIEQRGTIRVYLIPSLSPGFGIYKICSDPISVRDPAGSVAPLTGGIPPTQLWLKDQAPAQSLSTVLDQYPCQWP